MKRRELLKGLSAMLPSLWIPELYGRSFSNLQDFEIEEPIAKGPFQPTWDSLASYKTPDWFRNAKFGIWAHWGPQCEPEFGDWYARLMYIQDHPKYKYHVEKYGHPSKFGFKDVIHEWKADKWDPESLVSLYKKAGAKYFFAMANHCDNFDLYNSKYQNQWNSTKVGPKKDIIAGWRKAAHNNDLPFGVSVHASHAWMWMETSQWSDKKGALAAISYDGKLSKADGKGLWWKGFDPQELYAQNHSLSKTTNQGFSQEEWEWKNGISIPSNAYCQKFYNRTIDLINKYDPDIVYFDDTVLPFWPFSNVSLKILAHFYNQSIKKHGKLQGVVNGKFLDEHQRKCMVWDFERGLSNAIEPLPWQTDTCIGDWHYDRQLYDKNGYKKPATVIQSLVDVVSKNGNMLLNIPVRGNGTIDEKELAIVEAISEWMKINSEGIYETRPWEIYGEGPIADAEAAAKKEAGFNEGKNKPYTANDIRFTTKGAFLYAFLLGWPGEKEAVIKSLATTSPLLTGKKIQYVSLLGYKGNLDWQQGSEGLKIKMPLQSPCKYAYTLKISGAI